MAVMADIKTVQKYVAPGRYHQAQRVCQFLADNEEVRVKVVKDTAVGLLGGAWTGGVIGAGLGFLAGFFTNKKVLPFCMAAGAVIGAAVCTAGLARENYVHIKSAHIYDKWLEKATAEKVYPIFQKYLRDEHLDPFLCSLSGDLIRVPVKDPHGCTFELEYVQKAFNHAHAQGQNTVACFKAKGGEGVHGISKFRPDQYVYDLDYHKNLMTALMPKFLAAENNPVVLAGLKAIRAQMIEDRSNIIRERIDQKIKEAVSGVITPEALAADVAKECERLKLV